MAKLFNYRFIVFCGVSLALGILFSAYFALSFTIAIVLPPLFAAIAAAVGYLTVKGKSILIHTAIFILLYLFGALSIGVKLNTAAKAASSYDFSEESVVLSGQVSESIRYYSDTDNTKVLISSATADGGSLGDVTVIAYVNGRCEIGDKVVVVGKADKTGYPDVDLYYFPRRAVFVFNSYGSGEIVSNGSGFFYSARKALRSALQDNLDEKTYPFIVALTLGETDELSFKNYYNLKNAGVSHIFAVSGLHIGFVAALAYIIFRALGIRRIKNALLVLLVTLLYTGVCGFPVSAIRAALMCFIYGAAKSFGKKNDGLNSVFLSMIAVLMVFPESLFSVGFILSYSAAAGISIFAGGFKRILHIFPEKLSASLSVIISAYISTAPIIVWLTGGVSLVSVLTNLIMLPVVSALYYFTAISLVFNAFGVSFAFAGLNALSGLVIDAVMAVDFGKFLFEGAVTLFIIIFYYVCLLISSDKLQVGKNIKIVSAVAAAISVLLLI